MSSTINEQTAGAELPQSSLPQLSQNVAAEPESIASKTAKAKQASGEAFLRAADRKNATLSLRVSFLRSKGFSPEEIKKCFDGVGQPIDMERINDAVNSKAQQRQPPALPPSVTTNRPPQYQASQFFSPLPPPREGFGWKDYFIASTVGVIGGLAAYKAATQWLPWEFVVKRKGDTQDQEGRRERRRKAKGDRVEAASEATTITNTLVPAASAPPAADTPPNSDAAPNEEVVRLRAELAEKSEQYTKVMREKVELTVKAAQNKSQQVQTSRGLENANKKIAELEGKLQELTAKPADVLQPIESPTVTAPEEKVAPAASEETEEVKEATEGTS